MGFRIELTGTARKALGWLDSQKARRITRFLRERSAPLDDPRGLGRPLSGPLGTSWCYRVGDYRLILDIQDEVLRILGVEIAHWWGVYH